MSRQLLRVWRTRPLPELKQGSTISIRSNIQQTNLSIRSKWKDDGLMSLMQKLGPGSKESELTIRNEKDRTTSLGRAESHVSIQLNPKGTSSEGIVSDWDSNRDLKKGNVEKQVIFDDGSILLDSDNWSSPPSGLRRMEYHGGITHITKDKVEESNDAVSEASLFLEVPEKVNIECDLLLGGSIFIHNKVEGDIRLLTTNGDVHVKKLRGHSIDIEAQGPNNSIFSSDLLEAQSLNLRIPGKGRLRAKRIHASTVDIKMGSEKSLHDSSEDQSSHSLYDNDDGGSLCDISSLYLSGDASIRVHSVNRESQAVRIKSNHGPVVVETFAPRPSSKNEMTGEILPIVEMGGVNGSCEIFVRKMQDDGDADDDWTSCRVHFDSISPDTVSLIQVEQGKVHITLDRKVESDLLMVSASNAASLDMDDLLGDDDDEDDAIRLQDALRQLDETSSDNGRQKISIRTKAFTAKAEESPGSGSDWKNIQLVNGWVENKSAEPDSRFDRKIRGESSGLSGGGKIRLEGAAAQALQSFAKNSSEKGESSDDFLRPLVAVASTREIVVETLSWLGNIARRYGMDDTREKKDLGRTAARRGRSLEPDNE